jgi:hypothetical protein
LSSFTEQVTPGDRYSHSDEDTGGNENRTIGAAMFAGMARIYLLQAIP